jgi:hypothetical protein
MITGPSVVERIRCFEAVAHRVGHQARRASLPDASARLRIPMKSPGHSEMMSPGIPT